MKPAVFWQHVKNCGIREKNGDPRTPGTRVCSPRAYTLMLLIIFFFVYAVTLGIKLARAGGTNSGTIFLFMTSGGRKVGYIDFNAAYGVQAEPLNAGSSRLRDTARGFFACGEIFQLGLILVMGMHWANSSRKPPGCFEDLLRHDSPKVLSHLRNAFYLLSLIQLLTQGIVFMIPVVAALQASGYQDQDVPLPVGIFVVDAVILMTNLAILILFPRSVVVKPERAGSRRSDMEMRVDPGVVNGSGVETTSVRSGARDAPSPVV